MTKEKELELVKRAVSGDKAAFDKLVENNVRLAGAVAFSILGDFHLAADVSQDAFIKAFRSISTLKEASKFKSWLYGIVRTTAIDRLRARKMSTVSLDLVGEQEGDHSGNLSSREKLEKEETRKIVMEAVNGLPENYREVIILKHFENMSYKEMAEALGLTESSVESRLFRARKTLRKKLKGV